MGRLRPLTNPAAECTFAEAMLGAECIVPPCFDAGNKGSLPSGRGGGNGSSAQPLTAEDAR